MVERVHSIVLWRRGPRERRHLASWVDMVERAHSIQLWCRGSPERRHRASWVDVGMKKMYTTI